jgi:hypothetical protein
MQATAMFFIEAERTITQAKAAGYTAAAGYVVYSRREAHTGCRWY